MYSNKLYTPSHAVWWAKARFAPFIASVMQLNGLDGGHYMSLMLVGLVSLCHCCWTRLSSKCTSTTPTW